MSSMLGYYTTNTVFKVPYFFKDIVDFPMRIEVNLLLCVRRWYILIYACAVCFLWACVSLNIWISDCIVYVPRKRDVHIYIYFHFGRCSLYYVMFFSWGLGHNLFACIICIELLGSYLCCWAEIHSWMWEHIPLFFYIYRDLDGIGRVSLWD